MERIQKRLQQIRSQPASVGGRSAAQKPATRPQADALLKDSTNLVTGLSAVDTERELPERAKLIARRLKQSDNVTNANTTSASRRLTVTLSVSPGTSETRAMQQCNTDGEDAKADENVPQHNNVSSNINVSGHKTSKPALGKR